MRRQKIALGECYHIYNRGVDKRVIFESLYDYERFKLLMLLANSEKKISLFEEHRSLSDMQEFWDEPFSPIVAVGPWCLMPNHFHITLKEIQSGGISLFMQKLCVGYSMYFNMSRERTGTLFEGRFKAKHIASDSYMRHLHAYIHLNPMKLKNKEWRKEATNPIGVAKHLDFITQFPHSSAYEYTQTSASRTRKESLLLTKSAFPNYGKFMDHSKELATWFAVGG